MKFRMQSCCNSNHLYMSCLLRLSRRLAVQPAAGNWWSGLIWWVGNTGCSYRVQWLHFSSIATAATAAKAATAATVWYLCHCRTGRPALLCATCHARACPDDATCNSAWSHKCPSTSAIVIWCHLMSSPKRKPKLRNLPFKAWTCSKGKQWPMVSLETLRSWKWPTWVTTYPWHIPWHIPWFSMLQHG